MLQKPKNGSNDEKPGKAQKFSFTAVYANQICHTLVFDLWPPETWSIFVHNICVLSHLVCNPQLQKPQEAGTDGQPSMLLNYL